MINLWKKVLIFSLLLLSLSSEAFSYDEPDDRRGLFFAAGVGAGIGRTYVGKELNDWSTLQTFYAWGLDGGADLTLGYYSTITDIFSHIFAGTLKYTIHPAVSRDTDTKQFTSHQFDILFTSEANLGGVLAGSSIGPSFIVHSAENNSVWGIGFVWLRPSLGYEILFGKVGLAIRSYAAWSVYYIDESTSANHTTFGLDLSIRFY